MRRPAGTSLAKDGEEVAAKGSWTIGGDEIRREIRREIRQGPGRDQAGTRQGGFLRHLACSGRAVDESGQRAWPSLSVLIWRQGWRRLLQRRTDPQVEFTCILWNWHEGSRSTHVVLTLSLKP